MIRGRQGTVRTDTVTDVRDTVDGGLLGMACRVCVLDKRWVSNRVFQQNVLSFPTHHHSLDNNIGSPVAEENV